MSRTILYKEDIIKILEELMVIIKPYHTSDAGANIIFDIETTLTLLDCDVKNILQFELMQQRIACLLKGALYVVETDKHEGIKADIKSLENSMKALRGLVIREIMGYNHLGEYLLFGFKILDYYPDYPANKETEECQ